MTYDPDRHHRRSVRLKGYDYSQQGIYFVTICTFQRLCVFGEVGDGEMHPNQCGMIVAECWTWLARQYPRVLVDEFVVMPNHLHGLIILSDAERGKPLGRLVGAFKTVSTKRVNLLLGTPGATLWQRSYHEHIVRHERALEQIQAYIFSNPTSWQTDQLHPDIPSRW